MADPLPDIRRIAREVRSEFVPDPRVDVFEIRTRRRENGPAVHGVTTVPDAARAFRHRLDALTTPIELRIQILPDGSLEPRTEALVRAPVAPLYRGPTMNSTQLSQYVMGSRLALLSRRGRFWRVRGEDAHVGWIHNGYLARGEPDWTLAWERATEGEPAVSLGATVHDEADRVFARLPWGARILQPSPGRVLLPDGRSGRIGSGEVVAVDRLWDRFPARGDSVIGTARSWMGAPYLWGGVTPNGVDCSGFVQAVYWLHGVALPRDSDMQARVGAEVVPGDEWAGLRPGDLLFFAERGRVNHVAMALGGRHLIHASASNGGVDLNDMTGERSVEGLLRRTFAGARRLLPD